ncbi:MAG: hypothetical protein LUD68_10670 [Rikenellaceae bacterium]|nr:hypothetical protein [Rikenellaceae bacterium]
MKSDLGFGASVGGFAKFDLTRGFAIQPELLVHYRNSDYKFEKGGKKYNLEY